MELDFVNNGPSSYDAYEQIFDNLYAKVFNCLKIKTNYCTDVTIINNKSIHEINRQYRKVDRPTDVISFAYLDDKNEVELNGSNSIPLGTILISYEKAEEQAKSYDHSLLREMSFLFVHGVLHLLGYDHQTKEEETKMFALQKEILGDK